MYVFGFAVVRTVNLIWDQKIFSVTILLLVWAMHMNLRDSFSSCMIFFTSKLLHKVFEKNIVTNHNQINSKPIKITGAIPSDIKKPCNGNKASKKQKRQKKHLKNEGTKKKRVQNHVFSFVVCFFSLCVLFKVDGSVKKAVNAMSAAPRKCH